ncbi:MAG: hypothetical protein ISR85_05790 [Kiritimatiellales bacterium]|nr:hypothetical protein [Kiritimatiellota bacterium]MBL7012423.1 hypothetical protein [Kiritimatiellales bacterium]
MHPVVTMMNWSHHLHDNMLAIWHVMDQHIHSRHFWHGVMLTLLIIGFIVLLVLAFMNAPSIPYSGVPYGPAL